MTSIIRADTDQLRAVARQMRATADQITGGHDGIQQSFDILDTTWSGRARDRGMARWAEIAPKYRPSAEGLVHMANELEALAQRLDDAAAVFGGSGVDFKTLVANAIAALEGAAASIFQHGEAYIDFNTLNIAANNPDLKTSYQIGTSQRPDIQYDQGFGAYPKEEPNLQDRLDFMKWQGILEGAEVLRPDLVDGLAAYRHYLYGDGQDRMFSYERYVELDPSGEQTLKSVVSDTQRGAQSIYQQMIQQHPELANQVVTFDMTSGEIRTQMGSLDYPYPSTENWQKAIGDHALWTSSTVTVVPGSKPTFEMKLTVHAEDRYDFNPGAGDITTGIADAENGRFEVTNQAHPYMNYSTLNRDVSWTADELSISNGTEVTGAPTDRQRAPSDNRRLRNKI